MKITKTIVVSAINLVEGGTLTILKQCLSFLSDFVIKRPEYRVVALVYDSDKCNYPNIEYIEIKKGKKRWLNRLYYEYFYFYRLSLKLKPYLWLSLHDITPRVLACKRAVYCHNPTPFYNPKFRDLRFGYSLVMFSLFYKYLYRINIKKNDYLIVQQSWLREEFVNMYSLDKNKVIVAYPIEKISLPCVGKTLGQSNRPLFFYPSLPRPFKNFEIIGAAVEQLLDIGVDNFDVALTIDGTENSYSKSVYKKYKHLQNIHFIGKLKFEEVLDMYLKTDCLIFPSRLETWGLPISEFAKYQKPMLLADLPYTNETAYAAQKVAFFSPYDAKKLAIGMNKIISNDMTIFKECAEIRVDYPFTKSWEEIFEIILS